MTRSRHTPVASFGDKLMRVLLKAALQEFSRKLPWNQAVRLRQRAYSLRAAMRTEKHPQYDLVSRVRITIDLGDVAKRRVGTAQIPVNTTAPVTIIFQPNDSEFDDALGHVDTPDITTETHVPTAAEGRTQSVETLSSTDVLEDLLRDLK